MNSIPCEPKTFGFTCNEHYIEEGGNSFLIRESHLASALFGPITLNDTNSVPLESLVSKRNNELFPTATVVDPGSNRGIAAVTRSDQRNT